MFKFLSKNKHKSDYLRKLVLKQMKLKKRKKGKGE